MAKKPIKSIKPDIKLLDVMEALRKLNKTCVINTLSEITSIINSKHNYIYVSFKIPITTTEVKFR